MDKLPASVILENTTDCVYLLDQDWRVTFCNEHAERELGMGSIVGQIIWDVFPGMRNTMIEERYQRAAITQEIQTLEIFSDISGRSFSIRVVPVDTTLVVFFRNLTGQKSAELEAAQTAAMLNTIINSAEDLIFVKDLQGRFLLTNRQLDNCGFSLLGRRVEDEFRDELAAGYTAADREVVENRTTATAEEIIPVRGEDRTFHTIKVPWIVDDVVRGVIGISRDITARKESEIRLRESEERYRLAAKAANDSIWDWDLRTGTVSWNQAVEALVGTEPGPDLKWWEDRVHPDDRERVLRQIESFIETGSEHWEHEYRFRRDDGSYAFVLDRGYVLHESGVGPVRMIGAMMDLTARLEAHQRLNALQNELIHVSRVSAMGTMASTLGHEINQPLTAIANYLAGARLLLKNKGPVARAAIHESISSAADEVNRVGEIIRRIRRMVAVGKAQIQSVELRLLIEESLRLALPNPSMTGIDVTIAVDRALKIAADPIQIQQVLGNLIRNAAEAMQDSADRRLTITALQCDGAVQVRVKDSGQGLPEELKAGLFTSFQSTKAEGLGVGLTICRTIVEAHGGKIWLERSDCRGTVISLELLVDP